jgi:agmatine/peptidylarginine deiminase
MTTATPNEINCKSNDQNPLATSPRRLPAEWEQQGAVLMAWPHAGTDWAYMLDEVQQCYRQIIAEIVRSGEHVILLSPEPIAPELLPAHGVHVVITDTNDTWTRDYGPLTAETPGGKPLILDFRFNGWGMKFAANFDNQATRTLLCRKVFSAPYECCKHLVLEGGSVESDGCGTILTTTCCLTAPNRNEPMSRSEVEAEVLSRFGARKMLWLDHGSLAGDDTDGHVDTLCRLAPGNAILYTGCADRNDEHYADLTAMAEQLRTLTNADGEPFHLIELPLPQAIFDEDGYRLPATYANYLVLNNAVLMPTYGQPMNDRLAADTLRVAFPDREIRCVDCRALIRQHGSLHCATMQLPSSIISFL